MKIEDIRELIYLLYTNNLSSNLYVIEYGNCNGNWDLYEYNLEDMSVKEYQDLQKEWFDFKEEENKYIPYRTKII